MATEEKILTDADFSAPSTVSVPATLTDADFSADVEKSQFGNETVFDENRGRAFEVQPGLSGKETEYVIGTGYDKKPVNQHFGLIDIGLDFGENFAKGAANRILSLPQPLSGLTRELGEKGVSKAAFNAEMDVFELTQPMMKPVITQLRSMTDKMLPRTKMDDAVVEMSATMLKNNKEFMDKMNLNPDQKSPLSQFYFDLGSGTASVATSVGLLYLTKNPAAPAVLFGGMQKGDLFNEARDAGKTTDEASILSSVGGLIEGGVEALGGSVFLRAASFDKVLVRSVIRAGEEGLQELIQQAGEEAVTQLSGVRHDTIAQVTSRIFYSGLLGAIIGGPAGVSTSLAEKAGWIKAFTDEGVSPETAKKAVAMISEKTMNDPAIQERVTNLVRDEYSPVSLTMDERVKEFKNVEKTFEEELRRVTEMPQEMADKNIAAEKIVAGKQLTAKEVSQFPDLADMQFQIKAIDEQLDAAPNEKVKESLTKRKEALLAQFNFPDQMVENPEITDLKTRSEELGNVLENAATPEARREAIDQLFEIQNKLLRINPKQQAQPISKSQVRELTGQIKKGEKTITESEALKRSMKRQEQAAREAASATKERIGQAQKLIRAIQKAGKAKNVAAEEKVEIDALQNLLKKAKTLDDLRQLNNKVQELKDKGREKVMASKELKAARFQAQKDLLLGTLGFERDETTGKFSVPKTPRLQASNPRNVLKGMREATMRAPRLLDALDGGANFKGPFHQILYDAPNRSYSLEVALTGEATARGVDILRKNGIKSHELMSSFEVDGQNVTMTEAMHIYAAMANDASRRAVILGNGLSPDFINKVITRLPEKFKVAADEIVGELTAHYDRTRAALLDLTDGRRDLPQETAYVPMRRQEVFKDNLEDELVAEIEDRAFFRRGLADPGFVKKRQEMKGKQSSIALDLVGTYFNHVAKREHFINMQATIKEMKALTDDPDIREAIRQSGSPEILDEIVKYVERVHNPYNYLNGDSIEKFSRIMRDRASILHIGLNVLVAAKQVSALPLFLAEVGPGELMSASMELTHKHDEIMQFIQKNDPQMKYRAIDRDIDEFRRMNPDPKDGKLDKIRNMSFEGVTVIDKWTASVGWWAKYNQMKKLGVGEREAIEAAQKSVLRTQNASAPKDIPSLYATSEFLNLFLQFTNQSNQIYNMLTYDIPMRAKTGQKKAALLGSLGVAMSYLIYYTLSHARLPDDPEELGAAAVEATIDQLPLFGPMINSLRKGYAGTPAAIDTTIKTLEAPFKATGALLEGDLGKALDQAAFFVAGKYRLPYTGIRRVIMGLSDLVQDNTDDLRRLIYSEAQLGD